MQEQVQTDYSAEYSDNLPALLKQLNIALVFTSYQAGRLMLVRTDGGQLDINYKSFPRPMGLAVTKNSLTLGVFTQVLKFQREDALLEQIKQPLLPIEQDITAPRLKTGSEDNAVESSLDERSDLMAEERAEQEKLQQEQQRWLDYQQQLMEPVDERTDACFITRSAHYSGMINIHDIEWGSEGLWAVNSSFSCLCTLSPEASFVPRWKPYFITELMPEDRCHLNGMALKDGKPAYVTTFSKFNKPAMWRKGDKFDGTLMDVEQNKILLDNLCMPHSPRYYRNKVYYCNSGEGQICCYDPKTGQNDILAEVPGFTRGMAFYGPFLIVGLSKVRQSDVTSPAPLANRYSDTCSGIWLFNLDSGKTIATLKFTGNVDQIYDVAVLTGCSFPELIEPGHPRMRNHFCFPALAE
ncbi:TIGR03032 family protein [Rheinheimera sediminis]|uniref:TIGR03032 family protein n=1 Tax=Rheinheimera sp. YQF-1 TaxID=2499626 RepID=UPI000FD9FD2A|nr:TIGR03032 family protein [Rheinheimera sp. YQF-1]RVT48144.1 TIGR03032 family protein [Rheinheimera sp. YQF-1]